MENQTEHPMVDKEFCLDSCGFSLLGPGKQDLPGVDSDWPFIRHEHEPTKSQATSIRQEEPI